MFNSKNGIGNHILKKLGLLGLIALCVFLFIPSHINAWVDEEENPTLVEERTPVLERNTSFPEQEQQTPQYVPGEVLVKFKEGVEPQAVLEEVDLETTGMERVHSIKPVVATFKKEYKLERDEDGWYWFRGKNYQELEDISNEEMFNQAYQQMSPTEKGLYRSYKIKLAEGVTVEEAVAELEKNPDVEYAEPNYIMELYMVPNDPYYHSSWSWGQTYDDLWGLKKINVETAWDKSQGEGVVVAVIDSGVDYNHKDLTGNIWINQDEIPSDGIDDDKNGYIDDVRGWDFANGDNDPMDGNGHGSHCAGTIAAVGNNGIGVIGIAPKAKIMPVKGLGDNGSGNIGKLAQCIKYAADNGAGVLSNSWGPQFRMPSMSTIEDAIDYAYEKNCVVVFAAGNNNDDVAYYSPANYPKTITVTAATQRDEKCSFSNYGLLIDVAAPGGGYVNELGQGKKDIYNILSTMPDVSVIAQSRPELKISDGYWRLAGTSMACPHVAGLAAVIKSMYPGYSPSEIHGRILAGADNIDALNPGFENLLGAGRINVYNSLTVEPRPFPKVIEIEKHNIVPREEGNIVVHVKNLWKEAYLIGVTLTTNNQWVTVQNDTVGFYDVQEGETRTNSDNPLTISLSQDCPFGEEIDFNLTLISVAMNDFTNLHQEIYHFTAKVAFFKDVSEYTHLPLEDGLSSDYVAMEDYNGDNYSDAYFCGNYKQHLYRNCQDGTFVEADNEAGITQRTYPALFIDINNDGYKDLFLGQSDRNYLYLNNGYGVFTDISQSSGISDTVSHRAIAFDYNNDGFVDICAAYQAKETQYWGGDRWRYLYSGGELYLLRNNGDCTFTKVREAAGLPTSMSVHRLCQMVSLDYDNDGDHDFLVSNIVNGENPTVRLYRNNGNGTFTDVTAESGIPASLFAASGVAAGDYNNDGYIDIFFTYRPSEDIARNTLFRNNSNGTFTDVTKEAGDIDISEQVAGCGGIWGTDFFDYDNDGDLDLYVTSRHGTLTNTIYRNNGNGTFTDVTKNAFPEDVNTTWAGAAIGDYNNDGSLDIYAPASLALGLLGWTNGAFLENVIGKENNWIKIKLEDKSGNNRLGYGAQVYVKTAGLTQMREVHTGAVETLPLHFGLGQASKIDEIEVHWPSTVGIVKTYNVDVNQLLTITLNTYNLRATAGLGGSITPSGEIRVVKGASQTFNISPDYGYHIADVLVDGVSVGPIASYTFSNVTSAHTIEAKFAINTYTLTITAQHGSVTRDPNQASYNHGTAVSLTAVANAGYFFVEWQGDLTGSTNPATLTMSSNKEVTAVFAPTKEEFTFRGTVSGGAEKRHTLGVKSPGAKSMSVKLTWSSWSSSDDLRLRVYNPQGTKVAEVDKSGYYNKLEEITIENLQPGNWQVAAKSDAWNWWRTISYTLEVTVKYTDQATTHTITATAGPGGTINPSGTVTVNKGASQTFSISPNSGYHIVDVLVDGVSQGAVSSYTFSNVTSAHTIEAKFAINTYSLTITAQNGSVTKNPDKASYNHGTVVSLTAVANPGYSFVKWQGDLTGSTNPATLTMNANKAITAVFALEVNQPPVANAGEDKSCLVGQTLTFDGSSSYDPDGSISSYAWDFGDGATGTGVTPTYTYQAAGTYTVTLTVTDNKGLKDEDTLTVTVTASQPPQEEQFTFTGTVSAGAEKRHTLGVKSPGAKSMSVKLTWSSWSSSDDLRLRVYNPQGTMVAEVDKSYWRNNIEEITITNLQPGNWQVAAKSDAWSRLRTISYTLKVTVGY